MISVCILTKNAERTLRETLDSAARFSEVLLLDNGSTDQTLLIAKEYPCVKVMISPFIGFGPLRNQIAAFAAHDWIFALDSDEKISEALANEILTLRLDPSFTYSMPRHNFYRGKQMKGCGWHPDRVVRLYHRKTTCYGNQAVHEQVLADSKKIIQLKNPLLHTPYQNVSDFLTKMELYTSLFAEQNESKISSSMTKAISHGLFAFLKSYILKRGFADGAAGFEISLYNANTAFYKYLKLSEKSKLILQKKSAQKNRS